MMELLFFLFAKEKNREGKGQGGKTVRGEMNNNKKITMALYFKRFRGSKKKKCVYIPEILKYGTSLTGVSKNVHTELLYEMVSRTFEPVLRLCLTKVLTWEGASSQSCFSRHSPRDFPIVGSKSPWDWKGETWFLKGVSWASWPSWHTSIRKLNSK